MNRDRLDDLLDASAPAACEITRPQMRAMLADARREVRPPRRVRRAVTLAGVLAILFAGGAGVATATSDWLWTDGLENPDRSYTYTAPTWGECELRHSRLDTANPLIQADVDRIIDDWFARTDVEAAAAPYVEEHRAVMEEARALDPEAAADPSRADLDAWMAHDQALAEVLHQELRAHGYDGATLAGATAHSQLHCDEEEWGGAE